MAPERCRVVLLAHRPETVQPCESELWARHLLDPPAAIAQHLDERRVNTRARRATQRLGVLVEHAMRHERDARHGIEFRD